MDRLVEKYNEKRKELEKSIHKFIVQHPTGNTKKLTEALIDELEDRGVININFYLK